MTDDFWWVSGALAVIWLWWPLGNMARSLGRIAAALEKLAALASMSRR